MKYFLLLIFVLLASGCSQGPDFSNPVTIISKEQKSNNNEVCYFVVNNSNGGVRGEGGGVIRFSAPCSFVDVGDTLVVKDGVITKNVQ